MELFGIEHTTHILGSRIHLVDPHLATPGFHVRFQGYNGHSTATRKRSLMTQSRLAVRHSVRERTSLGGLTISAMTNGSTSVVKPDPAAIALAFDFQWAVPVVFV